MATWASLTPAQQAQVQDLVNAERAQQALLARLIVVSQSIAAAWAGGTSTLVNSITDTIPNNTGLAGAQGVVAADVANIANDCALIIDTTKVQATGSYNSAFEQALRVKFCGINANPTLAG
jgi:hypothetical protein